MPEKYRNLLARVTQTPGSITGVDGITTKSVGRGHLTILVEPTPNYPDYAYFKRFFASVQSPRVAAAAAPTPPDDDDEQLPDN